MNIIYHGLSSFRPIAKSYTVKFLFIAFLGIHIPLIGLITFIVLSPGALPTGTVLLIALLCTLAATAVTLFILNALLEPLKLSKSALEDYLTQRKLPQLPQDYTDEAGVLMKRISETVSSLDLLLQEKKDLIGLLSHDLRTPLATILLLSKALQQNESIDDDERREIAANISASVKEQINLFQRILELLRNDDINTMQLQLDTLSIKSMLNACIESMDSIARQKQVKLQVALSHDIMIKADGDLLPQVLKNLLSNAIKFSYPGTAIDIGVEKKESGVQIKVKDQGMGFEPHVGEKLFDRFTAHRKSGTANEVSTGMGLYLSQKIIRAHNGTITAKSAGKNRGSEFSIFMKDSLN